MKSTALIFMVALLAVAHAASSQDMQSALDGRTYAIEIYLNGTLDSKETLVFEKGMMDPLDCHQWGFSAATCQAKKSGEMYTFRTVCKSEKEGTMAWQGKVGGSVIEGTVVWTKEGQEPINYTFTGKQVK